MADKKAVNDFALKWLEKFKDPTRTYRDLISPELALDCKSLDFEMDQGECFIKRHGQGAFDYEGLKMELDHIDHIEVLGSGIFSQWWYFSYWSNSREDIELSENRQWFVLAFSRLAELSKPRLPNFQGPLKKIRLVSFDDTYRTRPGSGLEVEERLTINSKGRVWFSAYKHGESYFDNLILTRKQALSLDPWQGEKILKDLEDVFKNGYEDLDESACGWYLQMIDKTGKLFEFHGSFVGALNFEGGRLSEDLRDLTGLENLLAFDGKYKAEQIRKISIAYHRLSKNVDLDEVNENSLGQSYWEDLVLDREAGRISHTCQVDGGYKMSSTYESPTELENFFASLDPDRFFVLTEGNPLGLIEYPNETRDYKITIDYESRPSLVLQGSFDKKGLPYGFDDFAKTILNFANYYKFGEILDPRIYEKIRERI